MDRLIEIARGIKAHGIKGAVKLELLNSDSKTIVDNKELTLVPFSDESTLDQSGQMFKVLKANYGNNLIVYFDNISTREDIESLLPFGVYVPREELPALTENEFYFNDLIGVQVTNQANKNVGKIVATFNHGASEVVVIEKKDLQTIELPFIDQFFAEVQWDKNTVVLKDIEYL